MLGYVHNRYECPQPKVQIDHSFFSLRSPKLYQSSQTHSVDDDRLCPQSSPSRIPPEEPSCGNVLVAWRSFGLGHV